MSATYPLQKSNRINHKPLPKKKGFALIQERIVEVVAAYNAPLNATQLPALYNNRYHEKLDAKSLGFSKLRTLLETIPSIECRLDGKGKLIVRTKQGKKRIGSKADTSHDTPTDEPTTTAHTSQPAAVLPDSYKSFYDFATKTSGASPTSSEESFFASPSLSRQPSHSRLSIGNETDAASFQEAALLGYKESGNHDAVFINTHIPFCMAAIGVQGAGKSHTLGCVLESCLLSGDSDNVVRLQKPMTALVLHYDQSTTSVCEAAGLLSANPAIPFQCNVPPSKAVVLVSPTYYKQRKAIYGEYCTVRPFLLHWNSLTVDHIKRIMRIGQDDNQLDVSSFHVLCFAVISARVLYQISLSSLPRSNKSATSWDSRFCWASVSLYWNPWLPSRKSNKDAINESMDISKALSSDMNLIIVDLTDPLLSKEEANSLFQVVTEQFRSIPIEGRKLLALDKAHEFMDGVKSDGLSEAIVNVARSDATTESVSQLARKPKGVGARASRTSEHCSTSPFSQSGLVDLHSTEASRQR
jgi:hypothetical protein